ncbi:Hypothetical predicted protein, partial [Pelobates cultripes]
NLSRKEQRAIKEMGKKKQILKDLKQNASIIIKPADKGGGVVIMDNEAYINEIRRQLQDTTTYQKLNKNPTVEIKIKYENFLQEGLENEILDKNELNSMCQNVSP